MNVQVFLEWFHRLVAGSVSTLLIAVSACVFARRELRGRFGLNCALALGLLAAQVVLGGLTVLGLLSPKWVSSHLAVGQAFFATILWLALSLREPGRDGAYDIAGALNVAVTSAGLVRVLAPLAALAVYAQIILGGLVSSNYAGLACPNFPTCDGTWLGGLTTLEIIQMVHRGGAVLASSAIVALCVAAWGRTFSARAHGALLLLPLLLAAQVFLGIGSVVFKLPLPMSVAHLGTAAALFGTLVVVNYEIRHG
jgi:cytochrome c oxidase assembly protein subunit 15